MNAPADKEERGNIMEKIPFLLRVFLSTHHLYHLAIPLVVSITVYCLLKNPISKPLSTFFFYGFHYYFFPLHSDVGFSQKKKKTFNKDKNSFCGGS